MHFSIHYDDVLDEWVLRLNATNGSYAGIGALNGQHEAEIVRDVLQGALELAHVVDIGMVNYGEGKTHSWMRGMKNANNIVEGRKLRELL